MLLHQYQYHHHDLWNWNMFSVIRQNVSTLAVFICVHPSAACPIHPFLPIAFAFSRGSTTSQEFLFSRVTFNRKELASPWKWKSSCCHPHCLRTLLSAESNGPHAVLEKSHRNISDMLLLWEPGYISFFILTTSFLCQSVLLHNIIWLNAVLSILAWLAGIPLLPLSSWTQLRALLGSSYPQCRPTCAGIGHQSRDSITLCTTLYLL